MTEMHDVVEMLLTRIKDYPEDFVGAPNDYRDMAENKWKKALRLIGGVVAPHEKEALDIRLEEAKRAVYMGAALKTILSDDEPEEEKLTMKTANRYSIDPFGSAPIKAEGSTIGYNTMANTINIGNANLTEDKINLISELEARVKAQEAKLQREYARMNANNTAGQIG